MLQTQIKFVGNLLSGLFFAPFGLHVLGFGSMDYSWVIYNNLQIMSVISQSDLKLPQNVEVFLKTIAPEVNYEFIDYQKWYKLFRIAASDNPDYVEKPKQEPYFWENNKNGECIEEDCRRLQESNSEEKKAG